MKKTSVGELIDALKRFPQHYTVFLEVGTRSSPMHSIEDGETVGKGIAIARSEWDDQDDAEPIEPNCVVILG